MYIFTNVYIRVRTCGLCWEKTCWGLNLSHVSTVWSAYGELARIATWVRSFGTWDLPKLPTHVRWTRSETWMQVWKNTLINDRGFMFCDGRKSWWDTKNNGSKKKQVLSLTCVQWRIFLPSCTHVPLDFPGQPPQVLSYLLLVVTVFSLPHPCAIRFPRLNPHKSYLSLLVVVTIFPLLHPCAS